MARVLLLQLWRVSPVNDTITPITCKIFTGRSTLNDLHAQNGNRTRPPSPIINSRSPYHLFLQNIQTSPIVHGPLN